MCIRDSPLRSRSRSLISKKNLSCDKLSCQITFHIYSHQLQCITLCRVVSRFSCKFLKDLSWLRCIILKKLTYLVHLNDIQVPVAFEPCEMTMPLSKLWNWCKARKKTSVDILNIPCTGFNLNKTLIELL